jgi:hypothetical protein
MDDAVTMARAVLKDIVSRLEPMEQEPSFASVYWIGDDAEEKLRQRMASGLLFCAGHSTPRVKR